MSLKDGRDYLLLIWKEPKTKKRFTVGELSKNGQFEFSYGYEYQEALRAGFELLIAFPDKDKTYRNDDLFPVFASRLPDPRRKGIEVILRKYGLQKYDAYELLKRSGAKLPIDNLEFIDPILNNEEKSIVRNFFVAGTGFSLGCRGDHCAESLSLTVNDEVLLDPEPENAHDPFAIKITDNKSGSVLGYLPRYYAQGVTDLIKSNAKICCKVVEVNKDNHCLECVKVELQIEKQ